MSEEGRRRREARRRTLSREGLFRRDRRHVSSAPSRRAAWNVVAPVVASTADVAIFRMPRLRACTSCSSMRGRGVAVQVREFQEAALVAGDEGHGGSGGSCTAAVAVGVLQSGFMRLALPISPLWCSSLALRSGCVRRLDC